MNTSTRAFALIGLVLVLAAPCVFAQDRLDSDLDGLNEKIPKDWLNVPDKNQNAANKQLELDEDGNIIDATKFHHEKLYGKVKPIGDLKLKKLSPNKKRVKKTKKKPQKKVKYYYEPKRGHNPNSGQLEYVQPKPWWDSMSESHKFLPDMWWQNPIYQAPPKINEELPNLLPVPDGLTKPLKILKKLTPVNYKQKPINIKYPKLDKGKKKMKNPDLPYELPNTPKKHKKWFKKPKGKKGGWWNKKPKKPLGPGHLYQDHRRVNVGYHAGWIEGYRTAWKEGTVDESQ